jgi:hypothetical protein
MHLGLTAQATDKAQSVLGNIAFSEGVHFWEFACPISIATICKYLTETEPRYARYLTASLQKGVGRVY